MSKSLLTLALAAAAGLCTFTANMPGAAADTGALIDEAMAGEHRSTKYKARDRYQPSARFRSYLLRIASNVCLSRLRKKSPSHSLSQPSDEDGPSSEPVDPEAARPGESLLQDELHARVRAAVAELPDRQRMAILLNKVEGLEYREVAEQLALSVPATKSLLHRARMALKEKLAAYVDPDD